MSDLISRQDAIKTIKDADVFVAYHEKDPIDEAVDEAIRATKRSVIYDIEMLPSAELERDIPIKPIETHDKAWGIPLKQAVCPKCDYYLGHVAFLGDYKGKRITYCETCGQAIDWEGWDFDE